MAVITILFDGGGSSARQGSVPGFGWGSSARSRALFKRAPSRAEYTERTKSAWRVRTLSGVRLRHEVEEGPDRWAPPVCDSGRRTRSRLQQRGKALKGEKKGGRGGGGD